MSESQLQAETSFSLLEVLTTSQDPPINQFVHMVSQEMPNCPWQPPSTSIAWSTVNIDAFRITALPQAAQVPMSTALSSVPVDPARKVELIFAPPRPTEVPLNNRRNAVQPLNYIDQCKNKLKVYVEDAMRSFADVLYMPMVNETSFGDGLEAATHLHRFRQKVWACIRGRMTPSPQCKVTFIPSTRSQDGGFSS